MVEKSTILPEKYTSIWSTKAREEKNKGTQPPSSGGSERKIPVFSPDPVHRRIYDYPGCGGKCKKTGRDEECNVG
jgi:hypothetical protein